MVQVKITASILKDNYVNFQFYRDGDCWYRLTYADETGIKDFDFPVPVSDLGTATLPAQDKALLYMRYMNKWLKTLSAGNES